MVAGDPGWISGTYENIYSACRHCGRENVHNRATDVGHTRPISNGTVTCEFCSRDYQVCGDLINPAHEMLFLDASRAIRSKNYMQAVLLACTACEVFFAHLLRVELVYRADRRDQKTVCDRLAWLNDTAALLEGATRRLTFARMRKLALRVIVDGFRPEVLSQSTEYIRRLDAQSKEELAWDEEIRGKAFPQEIEQALLTLIDSKLGDLRNSVVHKKAFRPTKTETENAVREAHKAIVILSHEYNLMNDDLHLNEGVDDASRPVCAKR